MMIQQKSVILHWTRLALADVLVEELQKEASEHDLCYIRPVRHLACGDLYQVQVAATEALLSDQPLLVFLTEQQLRSTVPLDIRTEGKCPDRLHRMLKAHAATVQPVKEAGCRSQGDQTQRQPAALIATEILDVSSENLQDTLAEGSEQHLSSSQVQQSLLCLFLDTLMQKLYGCQDQSKALLIEARCKLLAQLQRWQRSTRQQVVNAISYINEQHQSMWRLLVGVPPALAFNQAIPQLPYGRAS